MAEHPSIGGLPLVLGGNVFGWTCDRDASFAVLDAFYEAGGRMVDSAEVYSAWAEGNSGGESEAMIGEWMESRGVRSDMLIGTKTGLGQGEKKLMPDTVASALQASLDRLRTDYIDLYYVHRDDPTTPDEEAVAAYDAPYRAGTIREIGASNFEADRLAHMLTRAKEMGAQGFTVLQPQYNLVARDSYEGALQDLCVEHEIAVLPYFALAAGFLSGKYSSEADWEDHPRAGMLKTAASDGGWKTLKTVRAVADELGTKPAHVVIAWQLRQPGIAAPIASATSVKQLTDLVEAVSLELSDDQVARLNAS